MAKPRKRRKRMRKKSEKKASKRKLMVADMKTDIMEIVLEQLLNSTGGGEGKNNLDVLEKLKNDYSYPDPTGREAFRRIYTSLISKGVVLEREMKEYKTIPCKLQERFCCLMLHKKGLSAYVQLKFKGMCRSCCDSINTMFDYPSIEDEASTRIRPSDVMNILGLTKLDNISEFLSMFFIVILFTAKGHFFIF